VAQQPGLSLERFFVGVSRSMLFKRWYAYHWWNADGWDDGTRRNLSIIFSIIRILYTPVVLLELF